MSGNQVIEKDAVVIGAGVSGLVAAKCLKEDGFDVMVLEKTTHVGGLWKFREKDYGVMSFTHINVCKYNYCFSDFPFPDSVPDYPHHSQMAQYINNYVQHFELFDLITFKVMVTSIEQTGEKWKLHVVRMEEDGKTQVPDSKLTIVCSYVAIATGHHAKPTYPNFKGEETFSGEKIHSVDFNDAVKNNFVDKRVLVVGIGNSAVDVAANCASTGSCSPTYISSRSGTWVFTNYTLGFPTDLYISRFFFALPMWARNIFMETIMRIVQGAPWKWGLNPKMRIFESQPTVSPTLIHHIQRGNIKIVPNIKKIKGSTVQFMNETTADFDKIVYCTGYKIDLPFLSDDIRQKVLSEENNSISLYKNVFSPSIGRTMAFIGFCQPASGGLICMSEIQSRWFSSLCKGEVKLPSRENMEMDIKKEEAEWKNRWHSSGRHTVQKDPILYTDEIATFIGAKPSLLSNPQLSWRLLLSSCGAYQWRLKGPNKWTGAATAVKKVPVPSLSIALGWLVVFFLFLFLYYAYRITCALSGF